MTGDMSTAPPSGARRRAPKGPSRRPGRGTLVVAALPVLLLALSLTAGGGTAPSSVTPRGGTSPLTERIHACLQDGAPLPSADVLAVAAPGAEARPGGTLRLTPSSGDAPLRVTDLERGSRRAWDATAEGVAATTLVAEGGLAGGLATVRVDRDSGGRLAVQECLAPGTHWWFTGAGAGLDHTSTLVLANPDPGPAVVDIRVLGPDGPVETVGTRGLTLGPGDTTALDLLEVAPQGDELAVEVTTSRGRVVAAVADRFSASAGADPGFEWIPAQARAARVVRLAPVAARASQYTVVVANPGAREARVEVAVAGATGSFAPTEGAEISVPPGTVVTSPLPRDVVREPVAVTLRSTSAVTATVRAVDGNDHAYAAALTPSDRAGLAVLPDRTRATAQVTAGADGASVRVQALAEDGTALRSRVLEVDPGATGGWQVPQAAATVRVEPRKGSVVAAVALDGDGIAQVPVRESVFTAPRPAVVPARR